jgi:hypothetical protein
MKAQNVRENVTPLDLIAIYRYVVEQAWSFRRIARANRTRFAADGIPHYVSPAPRAAYVAYRRVSRLMRARLFRKPKPMLRAGYNVG